MNKTFISMTLLSIVVQFIVSSCGQAKATNTNYAESIQSNMPGFTCFLIRDENAKAVGGNCVKN